jgi:hypothetical protein
VYEIKPESPWQPDGPYLAALPEHHRLLISPAGRYHLMLTPDGRWWHLHPNGTRSAVDAGVAVHLRPLDCDLIIKLTMVWAWQSVVDPNVLMEQLGTGNDPATRVIDSLSGGIKQMIVQYAREAGRLK